MLNQYLGQTVDRFRIRLVDIDSGGDLDVRTSEENGQLSVIWFKNPYAR